MQGELKTSKTYGAMTLNQSTNKQSLLNGYLPTLCTLKEETFAVSRFLAKSAKVYSREIFSKDVIHKSFFQLNFLKRSSSANILKKIRFCSYDIKLLWHS